MSGKPILLVEDSDDDAALLKITLKKANLNNPVFHVGDVDSAICYLSGEGQYTDRQAYPMPSIIFLDLKLPNKDGFQLLEWVGRRLEFRAIFIIVLAGIGRIDEIGRAYRLGANTFLTKPCKLEDLNNLVKGHANIWHD